jgi:hypothetical protein
MAEEFAPTKLRILYDVLGDLHDREQTALAEWHAQASDEILHRLKHDLVTVEGYEPIDERFHDEASRTPLPDPPTPPAKVVYTHEFASQLANDTLHSVAGADDLAFRYIDREIFPLRQTTPGGPRPTARKLDLLLVSQDGLPIIGELKIREDRATYFAFIQSLMYAVELSSSSQRARMVKYYEGKGFRWRNREPFGDIYIIAFEPPKAADDTNRARSFEATSRLAESLVEQPQFNALIRRVVYLEASVGPDGFVFEPRFRFGS